jgi:hypothetical protein
MLRALLTILIKNYILWMSMGSVLIAEEVAVRISIPIPPLEPESAARVATKSIGQRGQSGVLLKISFGEYGGYSSSVSRP